MKEKRARRRSSTVSLDPSRRTLCVRADAGLIVARQSHARTKRWSFTELFITTILLRYYQYDTEPQAQCPPPAGALPPPPPRPPGFTPSPLAICGVNVKPVAARSSRVRHREAKGEAAMQHPVARAASPVNPELDAVTSVAADFGKGVVRGSPACFHPRRTNHAAWPCATRPHPFSRVEAR